MSSAEKSASIGRIAICSFGVNIELKYEFAEFCESELFEALSKILPTGIKMVKPEQATHCFKVFKNYRNDDWFFELHGETEFIAAAKTKTEIFECLDSRIRIIVAEFAVEKVFLHAGVVGWKGKALVLPGKSYHGKTTLVAELVKKGAEYFSDEYAVFDEEGYVHPFPKMLSMRGIIDEHQQLDLPVETFGGKAAEKPLVVGLVLLTEFEKDAIWKPATLSPGEGIMEMLSHTFSTRYKPEFSLKVLNKITKRAIITKTRRGEASVFANLILNFFEKQAFETLI